MTTIHSYTSDQKILDNSHKDLRRARSAGQSLILPQQEPRKQWEKEIPNLKGKLEGVAMRCPHPMFL